MRGGQATVDRFETAARAAERASAAVKDPELRKIAFDRILQRLLEEEKGNAPRGPRRAVKIKAGESSDRSRPPPKQGPIVWLSQLVQDGFFEEGQGQKEILSRLAQKGRHLRDYQITQQLLALVQRGVLEREKESDDSAGHGRTVWKYRRRRS